LLTGGCRSCWYFGKRCAFGRGKIAALFAVKGDAALFCQKEIDWSKTLPHFCLLLIPLMAGLFLLLQNFKWLVLVLMLIPALVWFFGNPLIYGRLACRYCKQGRICCPASAFFQKIKKKDRAKKGSG